MSPEAQRAVIAKVSPVNSETLDCPVCKADWRHSRIPKESKQYYRPGAEWFSRLIGVEIHGKGDCVDHWRCPDCNATFPRGFSV